MTRIFEFSDGLTHESYLRKGWVLIIPIFIFFSIIFQDILYLVFGILNFIICEFIDPDTDLLGLTEADGDILRTFRKIKLGLIGAMIVGYWLVYAEFCLYFGGHRSWFSHGWIIGTIGRMLFFNIPIFGILFWFYLYGVTNWNWLDFSEIGFGYFYMNKWVLPYIVSQFISWNIADGIHLILDTKWFKKLNRGNSNG